MAGGSGIIVSGARGIYEWSAPIDYSSVVFNGAGLFPNAGTFYHDASARKNNGLLYNTPGWRYVNELSRWATGPFSSNQKAVYVGNQSQMYIGDPVGNVSFWIRSVATAAVNANDFILLQRGEGDARQWFLAFQKASAGDASLTVKTYPLGTAASLENLLLSPFLPTTSWRHFSLNIRAAQHWDFYINGVFTHTFSATAAYVNRATWTEIGGAHNTDALFSNSSLADVVYSTQLLSPAQIQWLANPANNPWQPWQRKWWPVVSAATTKIPVFMNHYRNLRVSA